MTSLIRLTAAASISALALAAAACTPAEDTTDAETTAEDTNTTTVIEREVPADPVAYSARADSLACRDNW